MTSTTSPDGVGDIGRERIVDQLRVAPGTRAFEDAITATSTDWAPWYVVPADHKHVMQARVARVLVDAIGSLRLQWPTVSEKDRAANAKARQELEAEPD